MVEQRLLDPLEPGTPKPDPSTWGPRRRAAYRSRSMEAFREGLMLRGMPNVRASILDDLSTFFKVDAEQAVEHSTNTFDRSAADWAAKPQRQTEDEILDFYKSAWTWGFGLLWYSYLQAEGYGAPVAAMIAEDISRRPPATVLDFGAGTGAPGAMFKLLGYNVTLADIAVPLQEFCKFRFERRGIETDFIDLTKASLPRRTFDVVAAIQVFASVPDIPKVSKSLHGALKPRGYLYADYDVRERRDGDTRLYDDDRPMRRAVHKAGFVQEYSVEHVTFRYRRVPASGLQQQARIARDAVLLGPAREYWRKFRYSR